MRTSVDYRTTSNDNYKKFCKAHSSVQLSLDEWKNILYTYTDLFREYLLETGEKAKLPSGWGVFAIEKRKRKRKVMVNGEEKNNLAIDWVKTKEKHKYIYHLNYHSEGFSFRWRWFKETTKFKHSGLWYFKPARTTSRLIAHYIKIDPSYQHKYLEWGSKP